MFPATVPNPFSSEHDAITVSFGQSQIKLEWPHLSVTNETKTNNEMPATVPEHFIELVADIDDLALQFARGDCRP